MPLLISSTGSGASPAYRLIPSRALRALLLVLPAFTIGVVVLTPGIPLTLQWAFGVLTLLTAGLAVRSHWPGRPRAVIDFMIFPDGSVCLWRNNGMEERRRLADVFVSPALVVLSLGDSPVRRSLIIPADALSGEGHRRLRREVGRR